MQFDDAIFSFVFNQWNVKMKWLHIFIMMRAPTCAVLLVSSGKLDGSLLLLLEKIVHMNGTMNEIQIAGFFSINWSTSSIDKHCYISYILRNNRMHPYPCTCTSVLRSHHPQKKWFCICVDLLFPANIQYSLRNVKRMYDTEAYRKTHLFQLVCA